MRMLMFYSTGVACWTVAADCGAVPRIGRFVGAVPLGSISLGPDKLVHFVVVGSFALVLAGAARRLGGRRWGWAPQRSLAVGLAAAAILATIEEFTNLLTPHRGFSALDIAANCAGVLVFGGVSLLLSALGPRLLRLRFGLGLRLLRHGAAPGGGRLTQASAARGPLAAAPPA